jgi:hypothetical protein
VQSSELIGRQLSLLIMGEDDDEEDDWAILTGIVQEEAESDRLVLSRPDGPFALRPEWLDRIKPVDPRVQRVLLGADYVLPIRIGDLPASATPKQLHDLGLKADRRKR